MMRVIECTVYEAWYNYSLDMYNGNCYVLFQGRNEYRYTAIRPSTKNDHLRLGLKSDVVGGKDVFKRTVHFDTPVKVVYEKGQEE